MKSEAAQTGRGVCKGFLSLAVAARDCACAARGCACAARAALALRAAALALRGARGAARDALARSALRLRSAVAVDSI